MKKPGISAGLVPRDYYSTLASCRTNIYNQPSSQPSLRTVIGATYALHICKQSDHMEDVKKAPHLISYQVPRTTVTVRKTYRQQRGES